MLVNTECESSTDPTEDYPLGVCWVPLGSCRRQREDGVNLVVPDDRAFRLSILLEFEEAVVCKLVNVLQDLRRIPVDEACKFPDVRRVVFDDDF